MQDFTKSLHTAPTLPIRELVKELTIGQRSTDTPDRLAAFLHEDIFPKLRPFCMEIYFRDDRSGNFLPCRRQGPSEESQTQVPELISGNHPIVKKLTETHSPLELSGPQTKELLSISIDNNSHLLVPIQDGPDLSALFYLGSSPPCSFSPDFLESIQTLAAVTGSRLKSMAIIRQLKESMHALEYSDRLRTVLYEISEQAHSSENITDLYGKIHEKVGRLLDARNFFIALVEKHHDGSNYVKFPYYVDEYDAHFQDMEFKLDQKKCTFTSHILKTRQPLLLTPDNFSRICRQENIECVGTPPYSWLGAPFFLDHIKGIVAIQSYGKVIYTETDKELMVFVARHVGDALNRKRAVDELKKAKELAERAEKNKSAFLANMSHEIRTPMNGIIGLSELVLHSSISGQKRNYIEMIHSSADRLLMLINDILDFSKIEAGKLELDIAPLSLRTTIAGALEILAISAAKKNVELIVDCHKDVPEILLGDADKLSRVLINLVGNGIKFTNKGRVVLSVRPMHHAADHGGPIDLLFEVRDTGIGIAREKINHIFKAFSQVGTNTDCDQRGTGLGLVISGELVEMMGGKICVESEPGVGTTFYFSIRFSPGQEAAESPKRSKGKTPHPANKKLDGRSLRIPLRIPLRILLVEDEYINRTLAARLLEREGWQVQVAENGLQAMDMLKKSVFDLALMDIQMPEQDGYETTRIIRSQETGSKKHLPIIAMTAHAVKGDREKCLAAGMDGYISKPIRTDKLMQEIETVLQTEPPPYIRTSPKPRN